MNYFPRLTVLDVCGYGNISVAIPSFLLQGLHNVEELHVGDCSSVKEVFQHQGLEVLHKNILVIEDDLRFSLLTLSDNNMTVGEKVSTIY